MTLRGAPSARGSGTGFDVLLAHDPGLDPAAAAMERHAVRAVVRRGDSVLLMRTGAGAWKFPGGGVEDGESDDVALRREVREECGNDVLSVDGYLGRVVERSAARPGDAAPTFEQVSRYYACTLGDGAGPVALTPSEQALGLEARWVRLDDAVAANRSRVEAHRFVRRELLVLDHLTTGRG